MKISILCLSVFSLFNFNSISPIFNIEGDGSDSFNKLKSIAVPTDSKLGTATLITKKEKGIGSYISTLDINGKKVYSTTDCYAFYKYSVTANAIIDVIDSEFQYLNVGSSVSFGYTVSKGETRTYSFQVSTSTSTTTGGSITIGGGVESCKIEGNVQKLEETGISLTEGYSYTYSNETTKSYTVNYQVNEDGTYRLTKRGLFDVYVLQHFTTIYNVKYACNNGVKYAYTTVSYYTFNESTYILACKEDSIGTGLFKYNCVNNKYSLDQDYAMKYFPNNDVVFLD